MKLQFNLTTSGEDLDRFENREALINFMQGFDGVELMQLEEDHRQIVPPERVVGLHMRYFPYWLDFWNGDLEAVRREFGSLETAYSIYGGSDRQALIDAFRQDLAHAHRWDAEYVVFHVSDATIAESFSLNYRHSDEEVIDAAAELLNELFAQEDGGIALLVENLWQPGLRFTRPEMTRRLMDAIHYPNKGIMLDTGHLFHTNLELQMQEDGLAYIHSLLDAHGELCSYIRGVHLNQSVTSDYMKQSMLENQNLGGSYAERSEKMFWHAFSIDLHRPFTCDGVDKLIKRIDPEYLTFEFISVDREQHARFLKEQKNALKMDI